MKKFVSLLLACALIFPAICAVGCGEGGESQVPPQGGENQGSGDVEENKMTETEKEYYSFIDDLSNFPVNFVYKDKYYGGFDSERIQELSRKESEEGEKKSITIEMRLDDTLSVKVETAFYRDYDAYEWTVYFTNNGNSNSGILKYINAVDMEIAGKDAHLKGILGDHENQYVPYDRDLREEDVEFVSTSGRATHIYFPYFNVETESGGAMLALGWGGTWRAGFSYDDETQKTKFTGTGTVGMETYLKPQETVRTPLVAVVRYYERNEDVATNAWRRWFVDCNMPKEDAKSASPVQPHTSMMLAYDTGRANSDGSISEYYGSWKRSMDAYYDNGLTADFRWFDAGWYFDPYGKTVESDWWGTVGTWELDSVKWPQNTFRESVEYGHKNGTKTLMWFEPERVTHLDGMVANYGYKYEWVLSDHGNNNVFINNLGIPECLEWTLDRIIQTMEETGIDMYREDFNLDPGIFWSIGDGYEGNNRTGITENLYIQGHYALWDGILEYCAENGKCTFIDSCASGGGRNDLESMRRAVPFLRSDSDRTTTGLRLAMTTSLVKWLPYTGAVAKESDGQLMNGVTDLYVLRTTYLPHMDLQAAFYHDQDKIDWETLRQGLAEWEIVSDFFLKDFYTLTPYRGVNDRSNWTAYMYFDAEKDEGIVQAFRPIDCTEREYTVKLKGIDPDAFYSVTDFEGVNSVPKVKGSALLNGFRFVAEEPRTAILLHIVRC